MADSPQTNKPGREFDFSAYPPDTFFHERRDTNDRRRGSSPTASPDRRKSKDRRRRVDPTTFDKQYSCDEIEFMNAVQSFKLRSGKSFPSFSEVLAIAEQLGYRKLAAPSPVIQRR
jgi:hypothetical protein